MQILSYRGPGSPGGVSSTLARVVEEYENHPDWWFISDAVLRCRQSNAKQIEYRLDKNLIVNHYRYCNNFLWPVMHDMPEHACYSSLERQSYKVFNGAVARRISSTCNKLQLNRDCFVNDYQLSLMPGLLEDFSPFVFWHIPWPKNVRNDHIAPLIEIASGLIRAKTIGFHTDEYAHNFSQFVRRHLPQMQRRPEARAESDLSRGRKPQVVTAPLGIDVSYWESLAGRVDPGQKISITDGLPYVLSVDRADYTKGIFERLCAIDQFFQLYPQWRQKVVFLQVGARSRPGLEHFDVYWKKCQTMLQAITAKWSTTDWKPVIWIEKPAGAADLAAIYAHASVMLVSPLRDGLNLTAKEFVICQKAGNGVLALAPGAGVFTEIGRDCVRLEPEFTSLFARSIARCLEMTAPEKGIRARNLRSRVMSNQLPAWWSTFREVCLSGKPQISLEKVC